MEDKVRTVKIRKFKMPSSTVTSIVGIIIGLILALYPGQSIDLICRIAGILVFAAGVAQIAISSVGVGAMPRPISIPVGAIITILGLFVIIRPDVLASVLPFVVGIILLIHSISSLVNAIQLATSKYGYWWIALLFAIGGIGLGLILVLNSHSAAAFTTRIVGVFLIYSGISGLWIASRKTHVAKLKREEEEAIDVEAEEIDD